MLKTLLLIICDDCSEQFLYARLSPANSGPSSLDVNALTAFARDKAYRWTVAQDKKRWYHYCPECSYDYQDYPEDAGRPAADDTDQEDF